MIGTVYRAAARNEHGDPVDTDGNIVRLSGDDTAKLGQITGVIIGGSSGSTRSVTDLGLRGDVVSTDGMLGYPSNSEIQLQAGDVVEIDAVGQRFQINGPTLWGRPHSLTGRPARYQWIAATAN